MHIAIVVATHGASAAPMCNSAQMLAGQQQNFAAVDFMPGENVESLVTKLRQTLQSLDIQNGVLFLVDIFAGSPFNAASLLSAEHEDWDVISGVNIPMLVNIFIERETINSFTSLAELAKETGADGVKRMKTDLIIPTSAMEEL
ncbi:mannose/fructose/sorbose PTS transporter subunit IIA [Escherichia fergusonii]